MLEGADSWDRAIRFYNTHLRSARDLYREGRFLDALEMLSKLKGAIYNLYSVAIKRSAAEVFNQHGDNDSCDHSEVEAIERAMAWLDQCREVVRETILILGSNNYGQMDSWKAPV